MPIYWYEGFEIKCDECGESGENFTVGDEENNISEELYFAKKRLTEKGWIFIDDMTPEGEDNSLVFCCKECKEDYEGEN